MSSQLTSEELSDIMMHSLVLATALIEKFEIMEENNLVAHRAKQSVKTSISLIKVYVDKVFDVSDDDEDTKSHMKKGASHLAELGIRLERSLNTTNLMTSWDRKKDLKRMINSAPLLEIQQEELYSKIVNSGILDY